MLTHVVVAALLWCAILPATSALADGGGGPVVVTTDNHQGEVTTAVSTPASQGSVQEVSTTGSSTVAACTWMEVFTYQRLPLPPNVAGQDGAWWQQYCSNNGWAGAPVFVPTGTTPNTALLVSPGTLAQRVVNELQLPIPAVGLNPSPRALVNLAEWFWVRKSSWPTLRQRTQAGPVWAEVVAQPTSTTWDPGDASQPFTCLGAGTPYVKSEPADSQDSDCTYTYTRSSASQPQTGRGPNDRFFTVTVTTTWSVTWTGAGGTGGTLPAMTRSTSFPLAVAEREAVVTGASG